MPTWINKSIKLIILVVGILTVPMCKTVDSLQREAQLAYENENYAEAKKLLRTTFSVGAEILGKDDLSNIYYMLAAVHARLMEYDSMKIALDSCVSIDNNFQKRKRELLESYSIFEFNRAVNSYNNFFFEQSLEYFRLALHILKGNISKEYEGTIYRCLAFASWGTGNATDAISYVRKAAEMGDGLSKKALEVYEKEKKIEKPEKLEPRPRTEIRI